MNSSPQVCAANTDLSSQHQEPLFICNLSIVSLHLNLSKWFSSLYLSPWLFSLILTSPEQPNVTVSMWSEICHHPPTTPAPSIQRQLMQLLQRCCLWGLWTGAFSGIYVPIYHQTCPQRKIHLWVIQNPYYPHPTPTSEGCSVVTPNFKFHPGALDAVGWSNFQGCSVFYFFTQVILHVVHAEAPRDILQLPTHSHVQSLPNSISRISLDSIQFPVLPSLPPASSYKLATPHTYPCQSSNKPKYQIP